MHSLVKGMTVLQALSTSQAALSPSDVAQACGTSRATARRLLLTLRDLGYVAERDDRFSLRPKVMRLGDSYLEASRLPRLAHPHLSRLATAVEDTCSLTVLDGTDTVYVDRVKGSRIMTVDIGIGTRIPAWATSTGRVLLRDHTHAELARHLESAHLRPLTSSTTTDLASLRQEIDRGRTDGYVVADRELDDALRSAAAPVVDRDGKVVAAVNVSTHVTRTPLSTLRKDVVPRLLETATAISADWSERETRG